MPPRTSGMPGPWAAWPHATWGLLPGHPHRSSRPVRPLELRVHAQVLTGSAGAVSELQRLPVAPAGPAPWETEGHSRDGKQGPCSHCPHSRLQAATGPLKGGWVSAQPGKGGGAAQGGAQSKGHGPAWAGQRLGPPHGLGQRAGAEGRAGPAHLLGDLQVLPGEGQGLCRAAHGHVGIPQTPARPALTHSAGTGN